MVLLALIPLAIIVVGSLATWLGAKSPAAVTAQITGVLTGFIGVHRVISTWLDKRQMIGNFHKASAALKENLYNLEGKWKNPAKKDDNTLEDDFVKDLKLGIESARQITKEILKDGNIDFRASELTGSRNRINIHFPVGN